MVGHSNKLMNKCINYYKIILKWLCYQNVVVKQTFFSKIVPTNTHEILKIYEVE